MIYPPRDEISSSSSPFFFFLFALFFSPPPPPLPPSISFPSDSLPFTDSDDTMNTWKAWNESTGIITAISVEEPEPLFPVDRVGSSAGLQRFG